MSQNNEQIIDALKSWGRGFEGWFWDKDKREAVTGVLTGFRPFDTTWENDGRRFKNFSLTDPNVKRFISTQDEAQQWAHANPDALVRCTSAGMPSRVEPSEFWTYNNPVKQYETLVDVVDGEYVWKPLSETEVADD